MSEDNGHHGEKVIEEIRSLAIPPGWARASVGEIGDVRLGRQRSPKNRSADFPTKYVRAANITWTGLDLSDVLDMEFRPGELTSYRLQPGDVLLSEASGSASEVGKPAIWNGELEDCCFQNTVIRFRPRAVSSKFALVAFQHFARNSIFARVSKGVGIHHLSADRFSSMPFLLPPKEEQGRIVAKIEELFSDLDAGVTALKRAKANLKRYRAVVLRAAVEGRLTEEWRVEAASRRLPACQNARQNHLSKAKPGTRQDAASTYEPASTLLARILTERRQKWEADQLAKFAAAGKEPPKNWMEKYVEPSPPVTTGLPELPADWCWASVQQVGSVQLGRQRAPQNHTGPHMRPYLRVANVFEDRIDLSDVMEMNFTPQEFETFRLSYGDILLNEGQSMELVGRPAMYRDEMPGVCFTNSLVRFRVYDGVNTEFALKVFLAYLKNGRFQKIATITVNIAHLGAGRFSEIEFPLPPVEEQAAIIEEVDRHFSLIDAAEKAISLSLARAYRLRQSVLKQAFEGNLVPQDPTDEPASALLERLKVEAASRRLPSDKRQKRQDAASTSGVRKRRAKS